MSLRDNVWKVMNGSPLIHKVISTVYYTIPGKLFGYQYDEFLTKRKFKRIFGYDLPLENPKTLNEKLQWIKLNIHDDSYTPYSDKFTAREKWSEFGEDGLIPLLYYTNDWRDITMDVIPDEPCIVKASSGSHYCYIVRDKKTLDINDLRNQCRMWLDTKFYYKCHCYNYKGHDPKILIEKLILDKNGRIPFDYKLEWINGELQFVYCSVDREGENYRCIYDPNWNRLNFEWVSPGTKPSAEGGDIQKPATFDKMLEIGGEIAKRFPYVRTDFYDVDGKLYYGEITFFHGGGFDIIRPKEYDLYYGEKLQLPYEKSYKLKKQ